MTDVLYVVTVLVAFAALAGFIRLCDRVVGPDEQPAAVFSSRSDDGVDR
jgi:hypothetical protein